MELIKTEIIKNSVEIVTTDNIHKIFSNINLSHSETKIITNESVTTLDSIKCLPIISLAELSFHDNMDDCWIVIYDRVYDVSKFLSVHPGGFDTILDYAGRDATIAFRGTGHSKSAINMLSNYLIGELPLKERLFRKTDLDEGAKIFLSDIPE